MSVMRIGEMLQPSWARTAAALAEATSNLGIRWQPAMDRIATASQEAVNMFGALLTPAAVVALVLGLWRLAADLDWTGAFIIPQGLFPHWLVWIALAIGLKSAASILNRTSPKTQTPEQA